MMMIIASSVRITRTGTSARTGDTVNVALKPAVRMGLPLPVCLSVDAMLTVFASCDRVLSTAMKCFHEIQLDIRSRCPAQMSIDYRRHYVEPLVQQTRPVVLARCTMTEPYEQYFRASATTSVRAERLRTYRRVVLLLSLAVIALVLTRRRCC